MEPCISWGCKEEGVQLPSPSPKSSSDYIVLWWNVFHIIKPGTCQQQASAPGFFKLFLCGRLYVCVFVCVSAPEAINN